jgi:predicted component of type VI protein secretion system
VRTIHRFGCAFQAPTATAVADGRGPSALARFRVVWPGGQAALPDGEHVIGREPDLALFLDAPSVSRHHARLTVSGDEATLEDLGSKNGTFVGDRRLDSAARLGDGDVIRIGSVELTFHAVRSPGSTDTGSMESLRRRITESGEAVT